MRYMHMQARRVCLGECSLCGGLLQEHPRLVVLYGAVGPLELVVEDQQVVLPSIKPLDAEVELLEKPRVD